MATKVVNKRLEKYDVYIGRGSIWGNKYRIGIDGDREEVISKHTDDLVDNQELLSKLDTLKNKTLGCFCKPKDCHGDTLAILADGIKTANDWVKGYYLIESGIYIKGHWK